LTNSSGFGLDNVTTCEVFDFTTQLWRYVHPASPFTTNPHTDPVYLDGSLYWLTDCEEEPKVLSFDLHTETFHVICDAPFAHVLDPWSVTICILDNRLCVSKKDWPTQDIWSFQYSNKTWTKMCSVDLTQTFSWLGEPQWSLEPIAILDNHKLLLQGRDYRGANFILDLLTNSYHLLVKAFLFPYFRLLFSIFVFRLILLSCYHPFVVSHFKKSIFYAFSCSVMLYAYQLYLVFLEAPLIFITILHITSLLV
ncbi:hypothetical protein F2Q69_00062939, partial [Brassica cretica]